MHEPNLRTARIVSLIAATLIALASGTNYVYSAWGPQFATRLKLSATENNLIGAFGNIGMYAAGIPVGLLVDHRGPRLGVFLGVIFLTVGYYPLKLAYDAGPGSYPMPVLCLFSLCTGIGSCSAFNSALKTAALNYPNHRGTATAFPLSAFGLSAFFFSLISRLAFPDNTSMFLLMLATGTVVIVIIGLLFLRVVPPPSYDVLPSDESDGAGSTLLHGTKSSESGNRLQSDSIGAPQDSIDDPQNATANVISRDFNAPNKTILDDRGDPETLETGTDESSSLLSRSDLESRTKSLISDEHAAHGHLDIRGLRLLWKIEFWQQFTLMGLLTGIGLMTINNIGNDARALWRHYDDSASDSFIQRRQLLHVSTLSFCSFSGRLISGIGSDLLVKHLRASRLWCVFISAVVFCAAQVCAMRIENPNHLFLVSGITGIAYGVLFGCFPSIVAHTFGVHGMSQNWGAMTVAPVVAGNIFNPVYGAIYDRHSIIQPSGHRECLDGLDCYKMAYVITFLAGIGGIIVTLWSIWTERQHSRDEHPGKMVFEHDRSA